MCHSSGTTVGLSRAFVRIEWGSLMPAAVKIFLFPWASAGRITLSVVGNMLHSGDVPLLSYSKNIIAYLYRPVPSAFWL